MKNKLKILLKILILIIPFILGSIGLYRSGESLSDAMFYAFTMYFMNYGDAAPNIEIEIARWIAPVMTFSGVIMVVASFSKKVHNFLMYCKDDSVAVYGNSPEAILLKSQLKNRLIELEDWEFVHAHRYILADTESDNLSFYIQNRTKLIQKPVYMLSSSLRSQQLYDENLKLFYPEETGARLFWKQTNLYETSKEKNHQLKLVFVGFGKLGEELLITGLQKNIFSPDQQIEYHIIGKEQDFHKIHHNLNQIEDPIYFYSEDWTEEIPLIMKADRVIVCEQEEQLNLLQKLLFSTTEKILDVLSVDQGELALFEDNQRLRLFDWKGQALKPVHIFEDTLIDRAKRINLRYAHIYSNIPETEENAQKEWKSLNSFTRYSNISSADYHPIREQMLKDWNITSAEELDEAQMELLAELEHIRWCRYHYLNNWSYGIPENGKAKDPVKQIHMDLKPYDVLSEEEKEKDRENLRVLMSV